MPIEILIWPKWWYGEGFRWFIKQGKNYFFQQVKVLRLTLWVRYLFVPMFGMSDPISRLISFFIRLLAIATKLILLCLFLLFGLLLLMLYLSMPPLLLYLFSQQLL